MRPHSALADGERGEMRKFKPMVAYADVGSHGGIFEFSIGPTATRYTSLLHIYSKQISPDLIPVRITRVRAKKKKS